MKSLKIWLDNYSLDHQNPKNQTIHIFCVPLIFFSVVGLLHLLSLQYKGFSIGYAILGLALGWYLLLGLKAFAIMFAQISACIVITHYIHSYLGTANTLWALIGIFVLAWIGQFYGHKLQGKKPSFLTDLQYLLIGPLWVWLGHKK